MKYNEISPLEAERVVAEPDALVLDIRDAQSYREGHIDGAMLAHDALTETIIKRKEYHRPIMIYCYHGNSSQSVANFFSQHGFKNVFSMDEGYAGWMNQI